MSDSRKTLKQARRLIENKRYAEAAKLLRRLPDDPTAQKWLRQLESRMSKRKPDESKRRFPLVRLVVLIVLLVGAVAAALLLGGDESDAPSQVNNPTPDPNATPVGFVGDGAQSFDYAAYGIAFVPPEGWRVDTALALELPAPVPPLLCSAAPCAYLAAPESDSGVVVDAVALPAGEIAVQLLFAPEIDTLQAAQQVLLGIIRDETAYAIANDDDYTMTGSEMRPQVAGGGSVVATVEREGGSYTITITLPDSPDGALLVIYGDGESHQAALDALLASIRRT